MDFAFVLVLYAGVRISAMYVGYFLGSACKSGSVASYDGFKCGSQPRLMPKLRRLFVTLLARILQFHWNTLTDILFVFTV